ncbi:MAG: VWA domain-containing protein [Acidobacteriota bacterium]
MSSALVLVGSVAGARESFKDTTTALAIEVPVEVTVEGKPVRGLGIDDFELFDKGDRQKILSVEMIDLAQIETNPAEPIGNMPVVARRHFMLLFDMSFTSVRGLNRSLDAAKELIEMQLHPADLVSVATWSLTGGSDVKLGFTPDKRQVRTVLDSLEGKAALILQADPLRLAIDNAVLRGDSGTRSGAGGRTSPGRGLAEAHHRDIGLLADRVEARQGRREVIEMSRGIEGLAEVLRSVNGRKHVVLFSQGFDTNLLLGATDDKRRQEMVLEVQTTGDLSKVSSDEYFGSATTFNGIDDMIEGLQQSDCTVHTVDSGGIRAGGAVGDAGRGSKDGLFMIAEGTGGDFYENSNDLGGAMSKMLERTSVTYVLTFQPEKVKPNGKFRKLKVKVKDLPRRSKVVHRPGWFAPDEDDLANGLAQQFQVAQRVWDGRGGGTIAARAMATPLRTPSQLRGGPAYVPVLVEVDGRSFLDGEPLPGVETSLGSAAKPVAELFLYALSADGEIVDHFAQRVPLDPAASGELLTDRGFKLYAPMVLDAGTYSLRVLVRNASTGRTGLHVARLDVHGIAGDAPVLLPPFFPEPLDHWVLVRGKRSDLGAIEEPGYPYRYGETMFQPAVQPALRPGDGVPVFLAAYGLGDGVVDLTSAIHTVDDGRPVTKPRWKLDARVTTGDDGLARAMAAFEVPDVPPGDYELRMTVTNAGGVESTPTALRLRVLGPDDSGASSLLALSSPITFDDVPDPNQPASPEQVAASVDSE